VGSAHLHALARLGVGGFRLADPDTFEVANIQRQLGASLASLGRGKTEVAAEILATINPECDVREVSEGITAENLDSFLQGVDVVVDGLEFFALGLRRMLYRECRRRGIPVVNAGPIGYGAAVLVFLPGGPSFDRFFGIDDEMTRAEGLAAFGLGLRPGLASDIDPARTDFEKQTGPALISACMMCAAAAATEVLKLVCRRGEVAAAPRGTYYDPYRGRLYPLRPRPSLRRSLRGRILRWLAFRRFPALRAMHDRELQARAASPPRSPNRHQPRSASTGRSREAR
jgi:molybdopterin/thiamine biosynthesis adenylyltransferase